MRAQEFILEEYQPKPATFADGTLKLSRHLLTRSAQREISMPDIMAVLQRLEALRGKDLRQLPPTGFIVKTPNDFELAIIKSQDINTKKIEYVVATVRKRLTPSPGQRIIYLEDQVDEGWRDVAAGVATAGALALGSPQADAKAMPAPGPSIQAQAAMTPVDKLRTAAKANGIQGTELAQFLAQCAHESANFSSMEEHGDSNYFAKKYDPKYAPKTARILGNTQVGDGERYKGRGFIQLTGRDNYTRAGKALNLPLADNPALAARPDVAAVIAVWYWKNRVASKVKNFHNTRQVTRAINPAAKGLQSRQDQFKAYQVAQR